MEMSTVLICVALCLHLTMGQIQLRVYRGTLVHSKELKQIEVLQDHLLGYDANSHGEVSASACLSVVLHEHEMYLPVTHTKATTLEYRNSHCNMSLNSPRTLNRFILFPKLSIMQKKYCLDIFTSSVLYN